MQSFVGLSRGLRSCVTRITSCCTTTVFSNPSDAEHKATISILFKEVGENRFNKGLLVASHFVALKIVTSTQRPEKSNNIRFGVDSMHFSSSQSTFQGHSLFL